MILNSFNILLLFLRIFRVFREETSLIHRFALQIVYTLLKGLRSGGTDGTLQVLTHSYFSNNTMIIEHI
jgi:hypothetical protein